MQTKKISLHISITKEAHDILKKHFPEERALSYGVERCIREFDDENITSQEIKNIFRDLFPQLCAKETQTKLQK